MRSAQEHYDQYLGPVYSWMIGGVESAIKRGAAEMADLGATPSASGIAVDLGAGFGMHAIPLADRGFSVIAVDTCAILLRELQARQGNLPIATVNEWVSFGRWLARFNGGEDRTGGSHVGHRTERPCCSE